MLPRQTGHSVSCSERNSITAVSYALVRVVSDQTSRLLDVLFERGQFFSFQRLLDLVRHFVQPGYFDTVYLFLAPLTLADEVNQLLKRVFRIEKDLGALALSEHGSRVTADVALSMSDLIGGQAFLGGLDSNGLALAGLPVASGDLDDAVDIIVERDFD